MSLQFNSDSDSQDIVSLVGDMTGINTTSELKQITRACNEALRTVWTWIFEAYGGWVFDGSNQSDLPTARATLVEDQSKYTLPSEAITVRGVEFKDEQSQWHKLEPVSEEQIRQFYSEEDFEDTSGTPRYYTPYAGLIKLHPAPNFGQSESLRLSFDREMVAFASDDTTQQPGFAGNFHEAVAVGASYFIASNTNLPQTASLRERWGDMPEGVPDRGYKKSIKEFYSERFVEHDTKNVNQGRQRIVRDYK